MGFFLFIWVLFLAGFWVDFVSLLVGLLLM